MQLPPFDPAALTVWVMGPGFGELVIVRAPPGKWLVVDGCSVDRKGCGQRILDHYAAKPDVVVFSHPHLDHARGLDEIIRNATRDPAAAWPRLGMVLPPGTHGAGNSYDPQLAQDAGVTEQVVATILDRWRRQPSCQWQIVSGDREALGSATIEALSPVAHVIAVAHSRHKAKRRFNENRVASALLVTWQRRSVLLGSDLPDRPGLAWKWLLRRRPDLAKHDVYKIAHHGSREAIAAQASARSQGDQRAWVVTPFSKSGLPKFEPGDGVDQLLAKEPSIALTGLAREYAKQQGSPWKSTRPALVADPDIELDPPPLGFPDCYVMVTLPAVGPPSIHYGPGSLEVTP